MSTISSFRPVINPAATVLILGSMPGVLSLKAHQYYAHPRNAFWRIMASIYGFEAELLYEDRLESLKSVGVALWDVLHTCVRSGSLDSAIERDSRVVNDFPSFFQQHPHIRVVGFNGAEAEKSFNKYVLPNLEVRGIRFVRLPSSSPAHVMSLEKKIALWKLALDLGV